VSRQANLERIDSSSTFSKSNESMVEERKAAKATDNSKSKV
jgi:hypothetical protein